MRIAMLIALSSLSVFGADAWGQVARQEVHALQSTTLSDAAFLDGKRTVLRSHSQRTCDFRRSAPKGCRL